MQDVDAILGLHLWPDLPSGKVSMVAGPRMASADKLKITVRGKASHGSMPHQGIDAILAASAIIMNLQSVSSREIMRSAKFCRRPSSGSSRTPPPRSAPRLKWSTLRSRRP